LYQTIENKSVAGGLTLSSLMDKNVIITNAAIRTSISSLAEQMPLLNISVPVNIDKWNEGSFEPLVVISPSSFIKDETKLTVVKAYDKDGKVHLLDAKKAPNFPVIVVGLSERAEIVKGKVSLRKGLYFRKDGKLLAPIDEDGGGGGGGGGTSGGSTGGGNVTQSTPICYSDEYLYLKGMSMQDLSQYESWWRGSPEITLTVLGGERNGNAYTVGTLAQFVEMSPGSRSDINDGNWWNINVGIVPWDINIISQNLYFVFVEVDGGEKVEVSFSSTYKFGDAKTGETSATLSAKYTHNDGDDVIGTLFVTKCKTAPQPDNVYNVGTNFRFRLGN
jgi:Protein of unknown function (DUF3103)